MKKLMSVMLAFGLVCLISGCTPEQQKAVAKQLGIASAVTWIGIDNPTQEDIDTVKTVVGVIKEACCTNCSENGTVSYYATAYPFVDQYITDKIEPNQQPMARLGAAFILTSLDTAFAMNPSWGENSGKALVMIEAYCEGAELGLSMAPGDPVRVAATRQAGLRVSTLKLKK